MFIFQLHQFILVLKDCPILCGLLSFIEFIHCFMPSICLISDTVIIYVGEPKLQALLSKVSSTIQVEYFHIKFLNMIFLNIYMPDFVKSLLLIINLTMLINHLTKIPLQIYLLLFK